MIAQTFYLIEKNYQAYYLVYNHKLMNGKLNILFHRLISITFITEVDPSYVWTRQRLLYIFSNFLISSCCRSVFNDYCMMEVSREFEEKSELVCKISNHYLKF